ncbi:MAG: hypothetical protein SFY80_06795 [Verrucomicrobiota bacterium]|nr:hypothetical protein [Verrucomicrobiota bacterium]
MNALTITGALPTAYWIALVLMTVLVLEALSKWKQSWSVPALAVYGTAGAWYLVDIIYNGVDNYRLLFKDDIIQTAIWQLVLFLLVFRSVLPGLVNKLTRRYKNMRPDATAFDPADRSRQIERAFRIFVGVWFVLFCLGQYNVGFQPLKTLFPTLAGYQIFMWGRPRIGGGFSFFISTCGYLYTFVCAFFGVVAVLASRKAIRIGAVIMLLITWPNFFYGGTRHTVLAVVMPGVATYILFYRHNLIVKLVVSVILFMLINYWMLVMIAYRGEGIVHAYQEGRTESKYLTETKHLGLNMFEELCWINYYMDAGQFEINHGKRYFAELVNIVPRSIWKNKPTIGIDYAILRGQAGGTEESAGVFATVSTGMIGQGVTNFGQFFGPCAAGFLMAVWAAVLSILHQQRHSIFRTCLFLIGLGLTFNLGRDITLLVIFPFIFGFLVIYFYERLERKKTTPLTVQ